MNSFVALVHSKMFQPYKDDFLLKNDLNHFDSREKLESCAHFMDYLIRNQRVAVQQLDR